MDERQATARPDARPASRAATRSPFMRPASGRRRRFATGRLSRGRAVVLTIATLVIVLLALVAFARTQALKQVDPPIEGLRVEGKMTPGCRCPGDSSELDFRLIEAQAIDAVIVDQDGVPVRTLAADAPTASGQVTLEWDGTDDRGELVRGGSYRLRLGLHETGRSITVPEEIVVRPAR